MPSFPALELIDQIADVLWNSFQTRIRSDEYTPPVKVDVPTGWSHQLALDCEHLSYVLAIAYFNRSESLNEYFNVAIQQRLMALIHSSVTIPWNAADYLKTLPPRPSGFLKICSRMSFHLCLPVSFPLHASLLILRVEFWRGICPMV